MMGPSLRVRLQTFSLIGGLFREGYIITWIDPSKPREQAISEAFERILAEKSTPIIQ